MKKLVVLATAAFLLGSTAFAQQEEKGEKKCEKGSHCCKKGGKACHDKKGTTAVAPAAPATSTPAPAKKG